MRDLRVRFSLILAIALLPSLIFTVWSSLRDYRSEVDAQKFNILQSTRALETEVGEIIFTGKALLRSIGTRGTPSACDLDLNLTLEEFGRFDRLEIFDPQGDIQCAFGGEAVAQFPEDFSDFTAEDPFQLSSFHTGGSPSKQSSFLTISHGHYVEGYVQEIYRLTSNAARLKALTTRSLTSGGTRAAIVNREGDVLISNANLFEKFDPTWLDAKQTGKILEREILSKAGTAQDLYILATRVPNIFIAVSQPRPSWLQQTLLNPVSAFLIPLIGWVFAFMAIWMATNRLLLSHLKQLGEAAFHIAEGRYDMRAGTRAEAPKQIRELATAFDIMADRVNRRDAELNASLKEKEILLREIHHRVKNNLQIIISLMNIQKRELKDPVYNAAIDETRNRINAIALVHKALYESDNIDVVPMNVFLGQFIRQASRTLGVQRKGIKVDYKIDLAPHTGDRAVSIAMFIMEAMTNAVKHGVPDGGTIDISAMDGPSHSTIRVTDSGPSMPVLNKANREETIAKSGTGRRLMKGFARQLSGTYSASQTAKEYVCQLTFPKNI